MNPATKSIAKSARAETNRANAALSTGPITPEGKRTASLNALRHGLTGRTVLLPADDQELYSAFCRRFVDDLHPSGVLEESMVQTIADSAWRLDRSAIFEAKLLSPDPDEDSRAPYLDDIAAQLVKLSLYSQRISRLMHSTLGQLQKLQAQRRKQETEALEEAADLRKFNQAHDISWDPADDFKPRFQLDGFEFSLDQIDAYIDFQTRLTEAQDFAFSLA